MYQNCFFGAITIKLLERWQRSGNWNVKLPFYHRTKKNVLVIGNVISDTKQAKT